VSALVLGILGAEAYMGSDRVKTWIQASDINRHAAEFALRHPLMARVFPKDWAIMELNGIPTLNSKGGVRRDDKGRLVRIPGGALSPILEQLESDHLIDDAIAAWENGVELVISVPNGDDVGAQPGPRAIAGLINSKADIMFFLADRKLTYDAELKI